MSLRHTLVVMTFPCAIGALAACQASFQAGAGSSTTPSGATTAGGTVATTTVDAASGGAAQTVATPATTSSATPAATDAAPAKAKATVAGGKVEASGSLAFDSSTANMLSTPENEAILDDLKLLLDQNTSLTQMRIEGYADGAANADANLELSGQRAVAVKKALIAKGVAAEKLIAVGFGDKKPKAGQNQRIEFKVALWNGKNYMKQDPAGGGKKFE